jgi:hypothetical protein
MKPNSESGGVDMEVFDSRGDLRLIVGADQVAFQVCSRALARSSPVWEAMLYGPFTEGKAQQKGCDWEIPLPEDRPETLRILFSVVHARFDDLPGAFAQDDLLHLAVLADKYDMTGSLKPFWSKWLRNPDHIKDGAADELVDYLSVCHKLGYGRGFRKAFGYFVTRSAIYDSGRLYIDGFQDYDLYTDDHLWLLDILGATSLDGGIESDEIGTNPNAEAVKRGRKTLLKNICIKIKGALESLIFRSRCITQSTACNCAMLGALVRALASRSLDHWFCLRFKGVEDSITHCVPKFSSLLSEIRLETVAAFELSAWGHTECSPWAEEDEKYEDERMEILHDLVPEYVEHLKKQAEKSGLNPQPFPV